MNADKGDPLKNRLRALAAMLAVVVLLLSGIAVYGVTQLAMIHDRIDKLGQHVAATHSALDDIHATLEADADTINGLIDQQQQIDDSVAALERTTAALPDALSPSNLPPSPWDLSGAIGTREQFRARGH
jgi:3-dehydroquinate dehydratase